MVVPLPSGKAIARVEPGLRPRVEAPAAMPNRRDFGTGNQRLQIPQMPLADPAETEEKRPHQLRAAPLVT